MWPPEDHWRAPVGDFPPPWASAWGDDTYGLWADLTVNGATQRMRWIEPSGPSGFLMGSSHAERDAIKNICVRDWADQHEHTLSMVIVRDGFWLADTPCTQAFWQAVTGSNPSHFHDGPNAADCPVEQVSWDVVTDLFIAGFTAPAEWKIEGRLCLPNEEQWEYAARAGSCTAYWWGDSPDNDRANWGEQHGATTSVKYYAPNPWGLFDVHGNVWEWCANVWQPRLDVPVKQLDNALRVARGGSWFFHSGNARASSRYWWHRRRSAYQSLGFRFALRSSSEPEARGDGAGS